MIAPIDLCRVRTIGAACRNRKVSLKQFAGVPRPGQSFRDFLGSLPCILAGADFREIVEEIVRAHQKGRAVILGIGGHVIKCGLSPIIIELMERRIVTAVALNGSAAIHDLEIAISGETSEDVASGLQDGTFGMVRETADLFNEAISAVVEHSDCGMGALLAARLRAGGAPYEHFSILMAGQRLAIPITVHVAIGADTVHMHPSANGAAIGQATFNDFRLFAASVTELNGGIYLNIGSAVILPEVFLKAFTVAQNLTSGLHTFVTVNMDMMMQYRPTENVVRRPSSVGGVGYTLIGRHEIMVPLLAQAVLASIEDTKLVSFGENQSRKIIDWKELLPWREEKRAEGKLVVWTNGCFDLLHSGHIHSLQSARKLGDVLVVGVNSDTSISHLKGPDRPIVPVSQRLELLAALECVDRVVAFDGATPQWLLSRLRPDIYCKGADYAPPHGKPIPETDVIESYGGRIEFLPLIPGVSTSSLIGRIRQQQVEISHDNEQENSSLSG
jgi:rfaE bifunctional protein nucleotidyltransferase chain/domain